MSKQFKDMKSACKWLKDVYDATANETRTAITEQVYKDSKEYTYYSDTNNYHMYDTGQANSDFKNGIIVERSPYVRRRYYQGGVPRGKNKNAEARWFDKTWNKHKEDYQRMCLGVFNKEKEKQ